MNTKLKKIVIGLTVALIALTALGQILCIGTGLIAIYSYIFTGDVVWLFGVGLDRFIHWVFASSFTSLFYFLIPLVLLDE